MGTTNILGQRRYRLRQQRRRVALALGLGERKLTDERARDEADRPLPDRAPDRRPLD